MHVQEGTPAGMELGGVAEGFASLLSWDAAYSVRATLFKLTLPVKAEPRPEAPADQGRGGSGGEEASGGAVSVGPKAEAGAAGEQAAQVGAELRSEQRRHQRWQLAAGKGLVMRKGAVNSIVCRGGQAGEYSESCTVPLQITNILEFRAVVQQQFRMSPIPAQCRVS